MGGEQDLDDLPDSNAIGPGPDPATQPEIEPDLEPEKRTEMVFSQAESIDPHTPAHSNLCCDCQQP